MNHEDIPQYRIREKPAAKYIGMSVPFLRLGRMRGDGPPYLKIGRAVRYDVRDLDRWLESRRVE